MRKSVLLVKVLLGLTVTGQLLSEERDDTTATFEGGAKPEQLITIDFGKTWVKKKVMV